MLLIWVHGCRLSLFPPSLPPFHNGIRSSFIKSAAGQAYLGIQRQSQFLSQTTTFLWLGRWAGQEHVPPSPPPPSWRKQMLETCRPRQGPTASPQQSYVPSHSAALWASAHAEPEQVGKGLEESRDALPAFTQEPLKISPERWREVLSRTTCETKMKTSVGWFSPTHPSLLPNLAKSSDKITCALQRLCRSVHQVLQVKDATIKLIYVPCGVLEQIKASNGYEHTHSTKCKGLPFLLLFCIAPVCLLLSIATAWPQSQAASHLKWCFSLLGVSLPPVSLPSKPPYTLLWSAKYCPVSPVSSGYTRISARWKFQAFCNL